MYRYLLRKLPHNVNRMAYMFFPSIVDFITKLSTLKAQTNIKKLGNIKVLIDSTVIGHNITHETVWVETDSDGEDLEWLGADKPGYLARVPVQSESNLSDATTSIRYLAGIFSLAKGCSISIFESSELRDERISQPIGRFRGRGIYDYSLLQGVTVNYLADSNYQVSFSSGNESIREQRKNRLGSIKDPMYQALVKVLGEKNSQDAHHIYTAEINNIYCFLTMDFRLLKILDAKKIIL